MQWTEAHKRGSALRPAELLAALGIPSGPQEEAGISIPETRPADIYVNALYGAMESCRRLSGGGFAR
jgi:hypothetical protein